MSPLDGKLNDVPLNLSFSGSLATAALAALFCATCAFGEGLHVQLADPSVIRERQSAIAKIFTDSGCEVRVQKVDKRSSNVICSLAGETAATIVVGAHFDFAEEGEGIVDDWSGAALLPSLFDALKTEHRAHTFEFVAFNEEERGLVGSARFVKELSAEERASLRAFVNLECLGLTPPKVWVHRSTPLLVQLLASVATAINVPLQGVNVDQVGDDDTHPFFDKGLPVICIHSVTQETWGILHSRRDNPNAINHRDYYDAYKLVAFYLAYLDSQLPK